jgi:hypothetical protein
MLTDEIMVDDGRVSKVNLTDVFLMVKRSLMENVYSSASVHMIYSADEVGGYSIQYGRYAYFHLFTFPKTKTRSGETLPGKGWHYLSL